MRRKYRSRSRSNKSVMTWPSRFSEGQIRASESGVDTKPSEGLYGTTPALSSRAGVQVSPEPLPRGERRRRHNGEFEGTSPLGQRSEMPADRTHKRPAEKSVGRKVPDQPAKGLSVDPAGHGSVQTSPESDPDISIEDCRACRLIHRLAHTGEGQRVIESFAGSRRDRNRTESRPSGVDHV